MGQWVREGVDQAGSGQGPVLRTALGEHVAARLNQRHRLFPGRLDGRVLSVSVISPETEVVGVLVLVFRTAGRHPGL